LYGHGFDNIAHGITAGDGAGLDNRHSHKKFLLNSVTGAASLMEGKEFSLFTLTGLNPTGSMQYMRGLFLW
ncbi:MAG: hypothetical protein RRY53_01040, partial [Pseudoflavonifractor sp.]